MEKETLHRGLGALGTGHLILLMGSLVFRLPVEGVWTRGIAWFLLVAGYGVVAAAFSRLAPMHPGYQIGLLAFMVMVFSLLMHIGMGDSVRGMRVLRTLSIGVEMLCTIRATNAFLTANRRLDIVRKGRTAFYLFLCSVLFSRVILQILTWRGAGDLLREWISILALVLMFAAFILFLRESAVWFGQQADAEEGTAPLSETDLD